MHSALPYTAPTASASSHSQQWLYGSSNRHTAATQATTTPSAAANTGHGVLAVAPRATPPVVWVLLEQAAPNDHSPLKRWHQLSAVLAASNLPASPALDTALAKCQPGPQSSRWQTWCCQHPSQKNGWDHMGCTRKHTQFLPTAYAKNMKYLQSLPIRLGYQQTHTVMHTGGCFLAAFRLYCGWPPLSCSRRRSGLMTNRDVTLYHARQCSGVKLAL